MKTKKELTVEEFKELHSKRRTKTLTAFEKYKIMCTLKSPIEVLILAHLYTKFLHFDMKEFHQRKFDIQVGTSNYSEKTITNNLNSLEKKGYFTSEFKTVQGKQYKRLHFNINLEKMNEFLSVGDELKPENFSGLIETLRRENEVVKPNPYTKSIEVDNNDELDKETTNPIEAIEDNTATTEHIEPAVEVETTPIEHTPIEEIVEPKNQPDEVTEDMIIINNNQLTEENMKREFMNEVSEENFNEKTKLFMKHKDIEGVAPVLKDLMLSFDTINYLYSSEYQEGVDKRLDDKKATLDILYDIKIKKLINK